MFDRAACVTDVRSLTDPFVSLEALGALSALLDQVLKTDAPSSNARLRDAYGISRDQNPGETHGREDGVSDRDSAQAAPRATADGYVKTLLGEDTSKFGKYMLLPTTAHGFHFHSFGVAL